MASEMDESRREFLKMSGLGALIAAVTGSGLLNLLSFGDNTEGQEAESGEIVEGKPL